MVDPVVAQPTPPKTPLIVRVVDGFGRSLPDAEVEVVNFRTELNGTSKDVKKQTNAQGRAEFGPVDPRIQFDIKVRKSGFGPPTKPFTPGENRIVRRTPLKSKPIELVLTRNVARLIVVARDATASITLSGANIGVDGITGTPMPLSGADGTAGTFEVPVGVAIRFHADKANFGPQAGGTPFNAVAEGTHTFTDGETFTAELLLHQAPLVSPVVDVADLVVLVKKAHTTPKRRAVTFRTDAPFDGSAHLEFEGTGAVQVFKTATGLTAIAAGTDIFAGVVPTTGVTLFLEGATVSGAMKSLTLKLVLTGGTKTKLGPAKTTITVVDLTLDICQGRVSAAAEPVAFSEADKIGVGRVVQRQDAANPRQRARLIVRAVKPKGFAGTLTLAPGDTRPPPAPAGASGNLALFDPEAPGAGGAKANPHEFAAANTDTIFHVEGTAVSGVERDTGYKLGLKDVGETDADHVAVSVIQVEKLQASLDSTKNVVTGARPAAGTFETINGALDFAAPAADLMVVVRDAGAITVKALNVKPPGEAARLRWQIDQDPADTVAKGLPALDKQTGQEVKVTPNAPGTFRLICYSDVNANSKHEAGEELRVLRMVIVRITPQAGATLTAFNAFVAQVNSVATNPAMRLQEDFLLEGGGANRKFGLDQIVLANVGNVFSDTFVVNYPGLPPPGNPANGTETEDPDFRTNPAPGFPSPMVDTVGVVAGAEPNGGTSPNRGNSVEAILGDGPGGNGELRRIRSLDPPAFVWDGNHPTTGNPWATTSGVNAFREWILAHAKKFPRNYMALGTGEWTFTANGTAGAGGLWVNSVATPSSVTATAWTIINPPRPADTGAPAAQVLGRSFVREVGMIVNP